MTDIATTIGGAWFAFIDSTGTVVLMTPEGMEVPSYPERLALRQMLTSTDDDA